MGALLSFSIMAFIPLMTMWIAYRIFLSNKSTTSFNRLFIISGILLVIASAVMGRTIMSYLPAISIYAPAEARIETAPTDVTLDGQDIKSASNEPAEFATAGAPAPVHTPNLWVILFWAYTLGAVAISAGCIASLARIVIIVAKARRLQHNGTTIYVTDNNNVSPFSIGKIIVTNQTDYAQGGDIIIAHERGHILYRHTCDMIITQLLLIVCWYNPFMWLLRRDLKMCHEYQADNFAMANGVDKYTYQRLLLAIAAHRSQPSLANSFNYHNIKKRLTMMNSNRTSRTSILAGILPIAMLVGAILFSCTNSKVQNAADNANADSATESTADIASDSAEYYVFLIRGVDVNSKAITDGDFIYIGNLPYSDRPDSDYEGFVYPITGCLVTGHKDVIDKIAPQSAEYIIDYEKASRDDYKALAADKIQVVTIDNNQVIINTRIHSDEPNADVPAAGNEESRQARALYAKLSEAWPNLTTLYIDDAQFQLNNTSMDDFASENPQALSGIESVKIDGNTAKVVTWPGK